MENLFDVKYMDLNIKGNEKFETIQHLANLMKDRLVDVDKYVEDVKKREAMSSTGIGDGIAIPHAKSSFVKVPTVAFGRSLNGVEWQSLDDSAANAIFLIAVPEDGGDKHLKILQTLAVTLMDDEFKEEILNASSEKVVEELLSARTQ